MPERPDSLPLANTRSDRVKAVRTLTGRSARLRTGHFVAEGPQSVREAVEAHSRAVAEGRSGVVHDLFVTPQARERHPDIVAAALAGGVRVREASPDVVAAMTDTVTPQGLVVVCSLVDVPLARVVAGSPRLVAVLAQVRDPGNAGTVIRAADAAGADAVVLTDASVDVHNPKCVRASAGSIFHLPVVVGVSLEEAVAALRAARMAVLAADRDAETDLDTLLDAVASVGAPGGSAGQPRGASPTAAPPVLAGPVAWIFGNEAWGLPRPALALADAAVRVPVHGRAESLNLAGAATVCLYATARSHRT